MFDIKHTDNYKPEMSKSTRNRNTHPLHAAPPELPQQAYHAHLLKPDKKLAPSSIITLNHALWQGDVEAFLSNR